jgi:hypothetical protein
VDTGSILAEQILSRAERTVHQGYREDIPTYSK